MKKEAFEHICKLPDRIDNMVEIKPYCGGLYLWDDEGNLFKLDVERILIEAEDEAPQ